MNPLAAFANFFQSGGPFMYVILATGVLCLAIVAERMWIVGRAASVNSGRLTRDLLRLVSIGELAQAVELCRKVGGPVARVAEAVILRNVRDEDKLHLAAEGAAVIALPRLSRRLPFLGLLANAATLLGLLGTIFGLTTAFSAVGAADPAMRSAFLASGISQALNTTAFGLIVAVPTLLAHGFLASRVDVIAEEVDETSVRLIQALVRGGGSAERRAA
ncbi:MAG: MotA/TolQ/ExbB proton channel family protein [Krumholzibacteria bacterium]|nr:MotA/TolQ/ExbB proton channel family protein [Candidatus Krumholzibacteria bacterium]